MGELNRLRDEVHRIAVEHGFWSDREKAGVYGDATALALMVCEVAEAIEALRKGEDETEEVVDVIIRALDYLGRKGVDVERALRRKVERNKRRPWKHGKRF